MRVIHKIGQPTESDAPERPRSRRLRAVAVLPTLATLANLLCGFAAIHFCMRALFAAGGNIIPLEEVTLQRALLERLLPSFLAMAGYLIFVAMFFDGLDGRLARLARSTTTFGGQLDSAADMVSFGLAPAVLTVTLLTRQLKGEWLITPLGDTFVGRAAWIAAALFVACAAIRLARYNVENEPGPKGPKYFKGLPTPGAAAVLASMVILHEWFLRIEFARQDHSSEWSLILVKTLPLMCVALGLLMVSRIRYVHFGNAFLRGRKPLIHVLLMVGALLLVVIIPEPSLTAYLLVYALSGPVLALIRRFHKPASQGSLPADLLRDPHESPAPPVDHVA